jgi:hypothetical protein
METTMATRKRSIRKQPTHTIFGPRQLTKVVFGLKSDSSIGFTLVEYGGFGLSDMDAPEIMPAGSMVKRPIGHSDICIKESLVYRGEVA